MAKRRPAGDGMVRKRNDGRWVKKLEKDVKGKKVKEIMTEDQEDAQKLGVEGTPYFLVNNLVVRGALPPELFRNAIEMAKNNPVQH